VQFLYHFHFKMDERIPLNKITFNLPPHSPAPCTVISGSKSSIVLNKSNPSTLRKSDVDLLYIGAWCEHSQTEPYLPSIPLSLQDHSTSNNPVTDASKTPPSSMKADSLGSVTLSRGLYLATAPYVPAYTDSVARQTGREDERPPSNIPMQRWQTENTRQEP
jgi:hypothetical protein